MLESEAYAIDAGKQRGIHCQGSRQLEQGLSTGVAKSKEQCVPTLTGLLAAYMFPSSMTN